MAGFQVLTEAIIFAQAQKYLRTISVFTSERTVRPSKKSRFRLLIHLTSF